MTNPFQRDVGAATLGQMAVLASLPVGVTLAANRSNANAEYRRRTRQQILVSTALRLVVSLILPLCDQVLRVLAA